jgi:C4-dicarboxylate transporter DctM subunit
MFFSALSGSAAATVACIGGIMIPQMIRNGYDKGFATAVTTSAGALGPVIPPSVLMLIYGVAVQVSIADLFLAGVVPGIMIAFVLAIIAQRMVIKANFQTPPDVEKENQEILKLSIPRAFKRAIFALFAPIIILGGIYGGIFTPTEAAIVACVYALVVSLFIYRELKFRELPTVFTKAARSCNFLIIIALSAVFGRLLAIEGVTVGLAEFVTNMTDNKYIVLLIINVMLFLISLILDAGPAIIILAPILANVVAPYGVCMVHFGIIMVINLAIGLTTPPVGVNLLVGTRISGVKMGDTFRPLVPLLSGIAVILLLVTYIPQIAMFLPNLLRG